MRLRQIRSLTCLLAAAALLWSGATPAEQSGSGWLNTSQLTQKLATQGLTHVEALKIVHGHWEGEAFQHGAIIVFHANAQTGQVTFQKAKDNARYGH